MSQSQLWSDAIALCQSISDEDDPRWRWVLDKYIQKVMDFEGSGEEVVVAYDFVEVLALLAASLLEYAAYELGTDVDDVGTFLLLEQFKRGVGD